MDNNINKFKANMKSKIQNFIENGKLVEADSLIDQYVVLASDDPEAYSIKLVIKIMQGNYNDARAIGEVALKNFPFNKDIIFNMGYLMDLMNLSNDAINYYCLGKLFHPNAAIGIEDIVKDYHSKPKNSSFNVIHGTAEIANQMTTLSDGLKANGINSTTVNYYPSFIGFKADAELDFINNKNDKEKKVLSSYLAGKMIPINDIFHFHFGTSLVYDFSDLPILKELGKKVIMQYWGSEVRTLSKAKELNPYAIAKVVNEDFIKRKLEGLAKYIPDCLVDYELAEYVRGYHDRLHITRVAIDLDKFKFVKETNNEKFLIVHAPTSQEFKGTEYILKAIEELKHKYSFDFKLVTNMSHGEARKLYEEADLIIDQLRAGSHGVLAVEAMALGKPVISWISDFMKEKYPSELPIIVANPDNIKEKLEYVLNNKDMLKELSLRGRNYVEKYHDHRLISKNMIEIYKNL